MSGGQRAHIHPGVRDGVHADPVSQQGAPRSPLGGINREHRHPVVRKVREIPAEQFVHHGGFTRPAGSGYSHHGRQGADSRRPSQFFEDVGVFVGVVFGGRDDSRQQAMIGDRESADLELVQFSGGIIGSRDHVVHHPLQSQGPPVVGRVDAGDALGLKLQSLLGEDGSSPAPEYANPFAPPLGRQLMEVAKELHMSALIAGDCDGLGVLLYGGVHNFGGRAVVAEVDHLGARGGQNAPKDVDGGVVSIEESGGGYEPHGVSGAIRPLVCHAPPR